ncbi:MAG: hypothetical protein M3383_04850 [Actinomycetota bacterium]|nr:hypothetical protein [Actinomycetota bacterium]
MDLVFAYLDPGSGSVILQALLGGVAGIAVALKLFGRRVLSFIPFVKGDSKKVPPPATESDSG